MQLLYWRNQTQSRRMTFVLLAFLLISGFDYCFLLFWVYSFSFFMSQIIVHSVKLWLLLLMIHITNFVCYCCTDNYNDSFFLDINHVLFNPFVLLIYGQFFETRMSLDINEPFPMWRTGNYCLYVSVPEPQLDTFVLCRSKEYLTGIQLEDGPVDDRQFSYSCMIWFFCIFEKGLKYSSNDYSGRSKLFEMEPGVLYFICYKSIKALVESGKIDLLW